MQNEEGMKRVVFGIIKKRERFLLGKRHIKKALCWEFPGGKVEKNEKLRDALKRELKEELGINIKIIKKFKPIKLKGFIFYGFLCKISNRTSPQNLFHKEIRWFKKDELFSLKLCDNDKKIFCKLLKLL